MNFLKEHRIILAVCGLFLVSGFLRINDLSLYTDSTRYIIWGTSVAQLKGFVDDTQPDPDRYVVNAPLYAVVLVPALIFFPMSIVAAKVWTLLWAACVLFLFYSWFSRSCGRVPALIGSFLLAVNPLFLVISTEALSEAPFLALMFLIFITFENLLEEENPSKGLLGVFLLTASLSVLLREVAFTLVGALVVAFIVRKKARHALLLITCVSVFFALWMVRNLVIVGETPSAQSTNVNFIFQHALTPPDAPFSQELWARIRSNMAGFGTYLGGMLFYPFPPNLIVGPGDFFRALANGIAWGKWFVMGLVTLLLALGIGLDLKTSRSSLFRFLFLLFYFFVILTYPLHDIRFLLPALPFMIFYVTKAVMWILENVRALEAPTFRAWGIALVLVTTVPNLACDYEIVRTNLDYRKSAVEFAERVRKHAPEKTYAATPWGEVGSWVRNNTPEGIVLASSAKEPATFVGTRKILEINNSVPLPLFEIMLRDNCVEYILSNSLWSDYRAYELLMRESRRFWFEHVASVGSIHIYKVGSRYRDPRHAPLRKFEFDTVSATGWMRKGHLELLTENYREAFSSLQRSVALQPNQPEPMFQLFVGYALTGDSTNAIKQVRRMFTIARSTPYIWVAQAHLTALDRLNESKSARTVMQKSSLLFDVGRLYWNLGYRRKAYRTMQEVVKIDSSFFVGLLWAWHYGIQTGDTLSAKKYLNVLARIDKKNAVVRSFTAMTAFSDTLRRTSKVRERSRILLMIAQEYEKMELPEEAIDQTERSVGEDSTNAHAWSYLGKLFNAKKKSRPAMQAYRHVQALDPGNVEARAFLSLSD